MGVNSSLPGRYGKILAIIVALGLTALVTLYFYPRSITKLDVEPETLYLQGLPGHYVDGEVNVTNIGEAPVNVRVKMVGLEGSMDPSDFTIEPGETIHIYLRIYVAMPRDVNGTLILEYNSEKIEVNIVLIALRVPLPKP